MDPIIYWDALNRERGARNAAFRVIRMMAEDAAAIARIDGDRSIILEKMADIQAAMDEADAESAAIDIP